MTSRYRIRLNEGAGWVEGARNGAAASERDGLDQSVKEVEGVVEVIENCAVFWKLAGHDLLRVFNYLLGEFIRYA